MWLGADGLHKLNWNAQIYHNMLFAICIMLKGTLRWRYWNNKLRSRDANRNPTASSLSGNTCFVLTESEWEVWEDLWLTEVLKWVKCWSKPNSCHIRKTLHPFSFQAQWQLCLPPSFVTTRSVWENMLHTQAGWSSSAEGKIYLISDGNLLPH